MKDRLHFIKDLILPIQNFVSSLGVNISSYEIEKGYLCEEDVLVNDFITNKISTVFPNDAIISEEALNKGKFDDELVVWIIDPICGTTNFLRKIPFFANSISCIIKNKTIFSCIIDVNRSEVFLTDGHESLLNNRIISTSNTQRLDEAIISINCNQSSLENKKLNIDLLFDRLKPPTTRRIKIFESANLELAYVASGRLDAYINPDDKIWDVVAGSQIIKNAGGKYHILEGEIGSYDKKINGIIGTNNFLLEQIKEKILV